MPQDKDFKRLVRQRASASGLPYTRARAELLAERAGERIPLRPLMTGEIRQLIDQLAVIEDRRHLAVFERLKDLPPQQLLVAALQGLRHDSWRVRRACCRLLDDLELTEESLAALTACLDDPNPRVRAAAGHSLTCEHCKPNECQLDIRGVYERLARDPDAEVRKNVVGTLSWAREDDWAVEMLRQFATEDRSPKLRELAVRGLRRIELQHHTDAERRELPDGLRAKTERHPGKWVAIADGRIVEAARFRGRVARAARGTRSADVKLYWVKP